MKHTQLLAMSAAQVSNDPDECGRALFIDACRMVGVTNVTWTDLTEEQRQDWRLMADHRHHAHDSGAVEGCYLCRPGSE